MFTFKFREGISSETSFRKEIDEAYDNMQADILGSVIPLSYMWFIDETKNNIRPKIYFLSYCIKPAPDSFYKEEPFFYCTEVDDVGGFYKENFKGRIVKEYESDIKHMFSLGEVSFSNMEDIMKEIFPRLIKEISLKKKDSSKIRY